ncbi:MAG TPA: tannase/feruloyl esterase family alpha/beta hydrolase [Bryobacteraceae bacterium]|nr:tannase/feruloyl esterase family alpha/beta hydrolase [Bryobacteraceae bacterium]
MLRKTIFALLFASPAWAESCDLAAKLHIPNTVITSSEVVTSGVFAPPTGHLLTGLPAFCRVAATLKPTPDSDIRIEIWLPQSAWNGRLEGTGNGGFAGKIAYGSLANGLKLGYAVTNTDMGLATPAGADASIFVNHPERWADWGYRATHEMTVAAKQVVKAYYGRDANHAYFSGCSTGGEQALMEAERFPDDYDGIVGGAAAQNRTGVHVSILWNFVATRKEPGAYIPAAKLSTLTKAVVAACDNSDGVKDGLIADPRKCSFDPASLLCSSDDSDTCFTRAQVDTVKRLYAGPENPRTGQKIYPGLPPGSEFGWGALGAVPGPQAIPPFEPIFKWAFGSNWDWRTFNFDRSNALFNQKLAGNVNANSPDLDRFRAKGHKFLMYHGWADWLVAPDESLNYYTAVTSRYNKQVSNFYRLFMLPGMAHCSGGPGPDNFDPLSAVVKWVEQGSAPNELIATKYTANQPPRTVLLQRPVCPYPEIARYKGTGSTNEAASFTCMASPAH